MDSARQWDKDKAVLYEIDFLHVGDGERSGDAIALRYEVAGRYRIHVVDGGDLDAGERMVEHIRTYYGNPSRIDAVVCTHGDDDHSSGLRKILEAFNVGGIWMNRPWLYAQEIVDRFHDGRITAASLERRLRDAYPILVEIESMAEARGIPIFEAFQGQRVGEFTILAPSRERYVDLIPEFSRSPEPASVSATSHWPANTFRRIAVAVANWIREAWDYETLEEDVETTASNESSIVQMAELEGHRLLLTGDAGIVSLNEAADCAEWLGYHLPGVRLIQIPHHGSRHNVSPSTLDRWLGPRIGRGATRQISAYASVAKGSKTHPRRKVVNALMRRGARVYSTKGEPKLFHYQMNQRGWGPAEPESFSDEVEA